MAIYTDILKALAPEFEGEEPARLALFVELARARISESVFGAVYPQAVAYLAAHLLSVSARAQASGAGAGGPVASASTGGVSVSFGQSSAHKTLGDESLSTTAYGLEFLALRNSRPGTKLTIVRA